MALSPNQMYPGSTSVDSDYIDGKYKDSTATEVYDGTPLDTLLFNQQLALNDAIMNEADLEYNDTVDTPATSQLFNALQLSRSIENRFVGNQNFNVPGDDGIDLPSSTTTIYPAGTEFSRGKFALDELSIRYFGNTTGDTRKYLRGDYGSYYQEFEGDFTDDYYGVQRLSGGQEQTGVTISLVDGKTRVTVDMSVAPSHKFLFLAAKIGKCPDVSDEESLLRSGYQVDLLKPTLVVSSSGYLYNGDEPENVVVSAQLTENISTSTRYVLDNPFGTNVRFRAEAEIFVNGIWTPTIGGFAGDNDSTGLIAGYVRDEGLVIQTARSALTNHSNLTLNLSGNTTATTGGAPCRIWCYRDAV